MITINFDKAKEITKERLRADRAPLLSELDIKFQRALESGDLVAPISEEKQRLRDITKVVDTLSTLDELKNIKV